MNQAEEWFQDIAAHVGLYDEQRYSEFERCAGAKAIVDRRFTDKSCERETCASSRYWIRSCLMQDVRFYSNQTGPIESRICLP